MACHTAYSLGKLTPIIPQTAWIAPGARIIGDIRLGHEVGVWFNCVLRGDDSYIQVGDRTNIQDLTMIHLDKGCPCIIGREVSVGHSCILHGCTVEDEVAVAEIYCFIAVVDFVLKANSSGLPTSQILSH